MLPICFLKNIITCFYIHMLYIKIIYIYLYWSMCMYHVGHILHFSCFCLILIWLFSQFHFYIFFLPQCFSYKQIRVKSLYVRFYMCLFIIERIIFYLNHMSHDTFDTLSIILAFDCL